MTSKFILRTGRGSALRPIRARSCSANRLTAAAKCSTPKRCCRARCAINSLWCPKLSNSWCWPTGTYLRPSTQRLDNARPDHHDHYCCMTCMYCCIYNLSSAEHYMIVAYCFLITLILYRLPMHWTWCILNFVKKKNRNFYEFDPKWTTFFFKEIYLKFCWKMMKHVYEKKKKPKTPLPKRLF